MSEDDVMEISELVRLASENAKTQEKHSTILQFGEYALRKMIERPANSHVGKVKRTSAWILEYAFNNNIQFKDSNTVYAVERNGSAFDPYSLKRKTK